MSQNTDLTALQEEWKTLFQTTLPAAAKVKNASERVWPVHVDHCFARIILDNAVGIDVPWMEKLQKPAYKHMSQEQLEACIKLGNEILEGGADLEELNKKSLELRGKSGESKSHGKSVRGKDIRDLLSKDNPAEPALQSPTTDKASSDTKATTSKSDTSELQPYISRIALSTLTPYRKAVLTALCQVPRGQWTTYGAISAFLSTSRKQVSSARAVGNAMRNNPYAPHVPCHRVLASGGGIGGFHGSWGRKGKEGLNDQKKRELLRKEGVRFDGKGKVVGQPWEGFVL